MAPTYRQLLLEVQAHKRSTGHGFHTYTRFSGGTKLGDYLWTE